MMGGATPRSTAADEQGVFGLMAFLADSEKCADRLAELQASAQAARDAETDAAKAKQQAFNDASDAVRVIEESRRERDVAIKAKAEAEAAEIALDATRGKLVEREGAAKAAEDKNDADFAVLAQYRKALDEREAKVAEREAEADARKTEYDAKFAELQGFFAK